MDGILVPADDSLDETERPADIILRARRSASSTIRSALSVFYVVPLDSDGIPAATVSAGFPESSGDELQALVEDHGVSLALAIITKRDAGRTESSRLRATAAEEWLAAVRMGSEKINLPLRAHDDVGAPRRLVGVGAALGTRRTIFTPWG